KPGAGAHRRGPRRYRRYAGAPRGRRCPRVGVLRLFREVGRALHRAPGRWLQGGARFPGGRGVAARAGGGRSALPHSQRAAWAERGDPMTDRHALFQAVLDQPDDDLPRLALADWLDEYGEAERAELIRLQCAAPRLDPWAIERE